MLVDTKTYKSYRRFWIKKILNNVSARSIPTNRSATDQKKSKRIKKEGETASKPNSIMFIQDQSGGGSCKYSNIEAKPEQVRTISTKRLSKGQPSVVKKQAWAARLGREVS